MLYVFAMNYRHIYHAGNFADVVKHLVLALCLEHLRKKDAPFFVLDAHGGTGLYDLSSDQAQKTKEHQPGIAALIKKGAANTDAAFYLDAVRRDFAKGHYPGSPMLAARLLRPQDRMIANELHPEDMQVLKQNMAGFANVRVTEMDAFEVIRANIPPQERRGIVLIDPPYEIENNEHEIVAAQMQQWKKRWANGIYVLWYPIKGSLPVRDTLVEAATALGLPRTWLCEYRGANLPPLPGSDRGDRARMNAAGLIVFNAPYQVPERVEAALMEFAPVLGGGAETRWLVPDKSYQQG